MSKKKWDDELAGVFSDTLEKFLDAPASQMEPYVREEIREFLNETRTAEEVYDFCVKISKYPCQKISEGVSVGDISEFMKSVFELDLFYKK